MVRAITTSHIASHGGPAPACRIRSPPASTRAYSSSAADSRTVWQAKSRQVAAHVPLRSTGWTPWPRLPEGRTDEHLSKVRVPPVGARMDGVERLIEAFRARSRWSVLSKLDALLDLEQLDDPRIVPFLLHVLADQHEPTEVRIHVLKRLRNGRLQPEERQSVAEAVLMVLSDRSNLDLRLQAVLALAEFTNIDGVTATLGSLALDSGETIDVRYSAFTSLQRAGPTVECVAVLRQLLVDGMLGRSARTLLSLWRFE